MNKDINNANHPLRQKAIRILESIAEKLGNEEVFDCKEGDSKWFEFEDMIVNILNEKERSN